MKKFNFNFNFILLFLLIVVNAHAQKGDDTLGGVGGDDNNNNTTTTTETPCIINFPNADQSAAIRLCDMNKYISNGFGNKGSTSEEFLIPGSQLQEIHTAWLTFTVAHAGILGFTITPLGINDDLDFALYKKSKGQWILVRAATNGPAIGGSNKPLFFSSNKTGLEDNDPDQFTLDGITKKQESDNDGFVSSIPTIIGEEYLLGINNYYACNGFHLDWTGTFILGNCNGGTNISAKTSNEGILLSDVYPNPTDGKTILDLVINNPYSINKINVSDAVITDLLGRIIEKVSVESKSGEQKIEFNTSSYSPGMHQIQIIINGIPHIRKFIVRN